MGLTEGRMRAILLPFQPGTPGLYLQPTLGMTQFSQQETCHRNEIPGPLFLAFDLCVENYNIVGGFFGAFI